jgi:RimJ/RimL family protein N-acetyltransferase
MHEDLLTDRLRLREWRDDDLEPLGVIFAKPEVWHFPFRRGFTDEETARYLSTRIELQRTRGWCERAVELRASGELIGYLGLTLPEWLAEAMPTPEIGWRLDPDHWHRGLATEGARAALDFGFGVLGFDEVIAIYEPENVASGRVMERLGMRVDRDTVHPGYGYPLRITRMDAEAWRTGRPAEADGSR